MATCRKQKAIEEEDYDTAKAIKGEIADLRAGGARKTLDEVVIRVDATTHGSSQMSPDTPVTLPGEHPMPGSYPERGISLRASGDTPLHTQHRLAFLLCACTVPAHVGYVFILCCPLSCEEEQGDSRHGRLASTGV